MSTTYTPDPTATQSPAVAPIPEGAPAVVLPADGDAANASSVAQAFKVLGDYIAWLFKPRAQAAAGTSASNWAKHIWAARNARLQKRWGLDHMGMPGGQLLQWDENWDDVLMGTTPTVDGGNVAWVGPWRARYTANAVVGGTDFRAFAAGSNFMTSHLYLEVANAGATVTSVHAERAFATLAIAASGDTQFSLSWDSAFNLAGISSGVAGQEASFGVMAGDTMLGSGSNMAALVPVGIAFIARGGTDSTWQAYTKANGGSATYTNTGVSCTTAGVRRRFRIEYTCTGVGDDSTARAHFYIDGNFVAGVAVDITGGGTRGIIPFARAWSQGSVNFGVRVGPMRFRGNTWAGDVFV